VYFDYLSFTISLFLYFSLAIFTLYTAAGFGLVLDFIGLSGVIWGSEFAWFSQLFF